MRIDHGRKIYIRVRRGHLHLQTIQEWQNGTNERNAWDLVHRYILHQMV
jgi:hypothetical protein